MKLAIVTDQAVGGNFLAWSLLWLSGQTDYFETEQGCLMPLVDNPLTKLNSHQFRSNHARSIEQLTCMLDQLPSNSVCEHVYFHVLGPSGKYSEQDFKNTTTQAVDLVKDACDKVIVVRTHPAYDLYHCALQRRVLGRNLSGTANYLTDQEALEDYIEFYFGDKLAEWQKQGLTSVWDQREFLALNMRPFSYLKLNNCHAFDFELYDLPAHVCWLGLDKNIQNMLEYCGLQLDKSRLQSWIDIYQSWQAKHYDRIQFCWFFDIIIEGILYNRNLDLSKFNLDICREAAIQHTLLYQHNLNFKTWQLEKFTNTQQLNSLLEPNTHKLGIKG